MFHPIKWVLDRFIPLTVNKGKQYDEIVGQAADFTRALTWAACVFSWILYVVASAYPAWPLFNNNTDYWHVQLITFPLIVVQLTRDAATAAPLYLTKTVALLSLALLIRPFVLICTEMYMCNQLTDAEKTVVATCRQAYTENYVDSDSQLACEKLVNIDITSIAHGSCAYLVNTIAGMVQACEFLALVLIVYKDLLILFTMSRVIKIRDDRYKSKGKSYGDA